MNELKSLLKQLKQLDPKATIFLGNKELKELKEGKLVESAYFEIYVSKHELNETFRFQELSEEIAVRTVIETLKEFDKERIEELKKTLEFLKLDFFEKYGYDPLMG